MKRCSSCRVLPDPAACPAESGIGTVDRMRHQIERAGVMQLREGGELEPAMELLRRAAESLADGR